jgi:hypothetical protein
LNRATGTLSIKLGWVVALAAAFAAAGCAELKQADDWAMKKALEDRGATGELQPEPWAGEMKVPVEAQCTFTPTYLEGHNCCVMKRYTTGLDVDTAFARSMQEYAFSQKRGDEGVGYPHYHGHLYQAQAGAVYRVFGEVVPRSDIRLHRGVWIGLVIAKASSITAEVEPVYCEARGRRMQDQLIWHQTVQASIRATLPPTPARKP